MLGAIRNEAVIKKWLLRNRELNLTPLTIDDILWWLDFYRATMEMPIIPIIKYLPYTKGTICGNFTDLDLQQKNEKKRKNEPVIPTNNTVGLK